MNNKVYYVKVKTKIANLSDGETYWVNYQSDDRGYRPTTGKGLGGIRPGEVSLMLLPSPIGIPITNFALSQDVNIDPNLLKSLVG